MNKLCIISFALCVATLLSACNSNNNDDGDDLPPIPSQQAIDQYEYSLTAGTLDLARKSGCLACHAVDDAIVGPAWKPVSLRYKDYPPAKDYLVNKVKKGGKGAWDNVPMPPYSPRVTDETINALVERILQGEEGRVVLTEDQVFQGQLLAGETGKFQFLGDPDSIYKVELVSTVGDADLFVYDPLLPVDQALIGSSELRNDVDSVTVTVPEQGQFFEVDVYGYLDSEYEITLSKELVLPDPPIPSEEELAQYNYSLNSNTLSLMRNSGCLACHSMESIVVGPSFKSISLRFKDIPDIEARLIEKVTNGGKGYWGDVPMPPYSPRVTDQNIELLVQSILFGD